MSKRSYVIANWKMHKGGGEAVHFIQTLWPQVEHAHAHLYLAVPFTVIAPAALAARGTSIVIGAQNMHEAKEGAFTGEISALMLKDAGARFTLLGHSERRALFQETDELIERKLLRAIADDLEVILCIGESLEEKNKGKTEEILEKQLKSALKNLPPQDSRSLLIAYEPVWAIGTGKSATPKEASQIHGHCREVLSSLFGPANAKKIPILYGGSVHEKNALSFLQEEGIDGVLVGGASLDPNHFAKICINSPYIKDIS